MTVYRAVEPLTPDDWMRDSLCSEIVNDDVFFPEGKGVQYAEAKAVCARCPVIQICREYSLRTRQRWGVWGGLTPNERQRVLRERGTCVR